MEYRDKARTWAAVLLATLAVHAVLSLGLMATSYIQIDLLERIESAEVTEEKLTSNAALFDYVSVSKNVLFLLSAIVWLTWLYHAYRALTQTGSQATDKSPAWAVGCWFVPLINLLHPFRITRELWHRSANQNADSVVTTDSPPLVALWWLLYLGTGVLSRIEAKQVAESIEALISATRWGLYSSLFDFTSAVTAAALVLSLRRMQARWSEGAALAEVF